ncbi:hypothetical protein ACLMJK_001715 [Lecanora helva]
MEYQMQDVLTSHDARVLFGFEQDPSLLKTNEVLANDWTETLLRNIREWPQPKNLLSIGCCAFDAFLQVNVTGPPLPWLSSSVIFPPTLFENRDDDIETLRNDLILSLSVDGEALYRLIPSVELFWLAKQILNNPSLQGSPSTALSRLRVNFWHQQMLDETSPTLQEQVSKDLALVDESFKTPETALQEINHAQYLIERATIHSYHGLDVKAREDLTQAAKERSFDFALTGRLGKRTKFQEKSLSQLVVLAKSADSTDITNTTSSGNQSTPTQNPAKSAPLALDLNDDTLLESTEFVAERGASAVPSQNENDLPVSLQSLDPGNQPLLSPLDSIILLATASSITNSSPSDGLTREGTLPYADRVLAGGSSNWQVYTQALLVRSRIEGHRSRTIERGVLQLQAVVDQVIAETTSEAHSPDGGNKSSSIEQSKYSTFVPRAQKSESAPVSERLQYLHQLAFPPRWKLEAELADRWVSLGGLRTALEIYERLQMWAEVALCWAGNDREDKAREILRTQLYNSRNPATDRTLSDGEKWINVDDYTIERDPLPGDAPRLFCILGDIENSVIAYERAWEVSDHRYARAQRSLGKLYLAINDLAKADESYTKSLKANPQNHATWFALGCVRLQTEDWTGAVNAFGRAVEIEDSDAESWSNLAVALLKSPPDVSPESGIDASNSETEYDENQGTGKGRSGNAGSQKNIRQSFLALKRAAALKRDSFKIWQNLLNVAVQLSPPPYVYIVIAQSRLIDLLGKLDGEKSVDVDIVEALVAHLIGVTPSHLEHESSQENGEIDNDRSNDRRGLEKMIVDLIQKKITPLITSSRRLWLVTAKLSLHLGQPSHALASYEKAWRVTLNQPSWDSGEGTEAAKSAWREVSESTIDLADAYESLGERRIESGLAAGEVVAKDWKFKARSAIRSVLARAKEGWEGDQAYETLNDRLQELKGA